MTLEESGTSDYPSHPQEATQCGFDCVSRPVHHGAPFVGGDACLVKHTSMHELPRKTRADAKFGRLGRV